MTTIDVATGLPELPEGQFWRVKYKDNMFAGKLLYVQLRQKTRFGSRLLADGGATKALMCGTAEATILWEAKDVLSKMVEWTTATDATRFAGDYPPKRLEIK